MRFRLRNGNRTRYKRHNRSTTWRRASSRVQHRGWPRIAALAVICGAVIGGVATAGFTALSPWPLTTALRHVAALPGCDAARIVGLAPARRGEPGYWRRLDADRDGIACESYPPRGASKSSALVRHVADGDTFTLRDGEKIRVENVDTPEIDGHCAEEKAWARQAKAFTQRFVADGIDLRRSGRDRYGRTLARVSADGQDLGDALVGAGLARRWSGRRESWC